MQESEVLMQLATLVSLRLLSQVGTQGLLAGHWARQLLPLRQNCCFSCGSSW
jgi:hypothetical protein